MHAGTITVLLTHGAASRSAAFTVLHCHSATPSQCCPLTVLSTFRVALSQCCPLTVLPSHHGDALESRRTHNFLSVCDTSRDVDRNIKNHTLTIGLMALETTDLSNTYEIRLVFSLFAYDLSFRFAYSFCFSGV